MMWTVSTVLLSLLLLNPANAAENWRPPFHIAKYPDAIFHDKEENKIFAYIFNDISSEDMPKGYSELDVMQDICWRSFIAVDEVAMEAKPLSISSKAELDFLAAIVKMKASSLYEHYKEDFLLGLNPRRWYDSSSTSFIDTLVNRRDIGFGECAYCSSKNKNVSVKKCRKAADIGSDKSIIMCKSIFPVPPQEASDNAIVHVNITKIRGRETKFAGSVRFSATLLSFLMLMNAL